MENCDSANSPVQSHATTTICLVPSVPTVVVDAYQARPSLSAPQHNWEDEYIKKILIGQGNMVLLWLCSDIKGVMRGSTSWGTTQFMGG